MTTPELASDDVLRIRDIGWLRVINLYVATGLAIHQVADGAPIPGSHWGDEEAGLIRSSLFARDDTPVHSLLHEAGHWLLMDDARRQRLHTDAKGSAVEEMAVCYLQVLMSDLLPEVGRQRMFADMDRWGYSFRCGSTKAWFETDAEDALAYLADRLAHLDGIPGIQSVLPDGAIFE